MAKVISEFDTVAKTFSVKVDGKDVENIEYFSVSKLYQDDNDKKPEFSMRVSTAVIDEESGTNHYYTMVASEAFEAAKAGLQESKHNGLYIEKSESPVAQAIAEYFKE